DRAVRRRRERGQQRPKARRGRDEMRLVRDLEQRAVEVEKQRCPAGPWRQSVISHRLDLTTARTRSAKPGGSVECDGQALRLRRHRVEAAALVLAGVVEAPCRVEV